jgi:hypothetical protein
MWDLPWGTTIEGLPFGGPPFGDVHLETPLDINLGDPTLGTSILHIVPSRKTDKNEYIHPSADAYEGLYRQYLMSIIMAI